MMRGVLVTVVLAVLVFAALSVASDLRALGTSLSHFRPSAFGTAVALVLGNYVLRFVRWQYYLRHLSIRVTTQKSFAVLYSEFWLPPMSPKLATFSGR